MLFNYELKVVGNEDVEDKKVVAVADAIANSLDEWEDEMGCFTYERVDDMRFNLEFESVFELTSEVNMVTIWSRAVKLLGTDNIASVEYRDM